MTKGIMNFKQFNIILYLCMGFSCHVVFADLYNATLEYQQKQFPKAFKSFETLAKFGNADAMYNLAVMSLHGKGTNKSLPKAYAWFMLASEFGAQDAEQTAQLVKQRYTDPYVLDDMYEAMQKTYAYQVIADKYFPHSLQALSPLKNLKKSKDIQPKYPIQAVRKGLEGWVWAEFDIDKSGAVTNISIIDSHPKNIFTSSLINALSRWRYKTNTPVQNRSLTYHFTTYKGEQYKKTLQSQRKQYQNDIIKHVDAAEKGNANIQYYISQWLSSDKYNASKLLKYHWRDNNAAMSLLFAAAKNNSPFAQYKLGTGLLNKGNTITNQRIGLNWLIVAAEQNMAPAQYQLALEFLNSDSPHFTPNEGLNWLEKAVDNDHFRALITYIGVLIDSNAPKKDIQNRLEQAFEEDENHPTLLLLQAKFTNNKNKALLIAQTAKNEAINRKWSTYDIEQYINLVQQNDVK